MFFYSGTLSKILKLKAAEAWANDGLIQHSEDESVTFKIFTQIKKALASKRHYLGPSIPKESNLRSPTSLVNGISASL